MEVIPAKETNKGGRQRYDKRTDGFLQSLSIQHYRIKAITYGTALVP